MVMKIIYDTETESHLIDIEERDLDMEWIRVVYADGYGACDISVGEHTMTWDQLDKLKQAIQLAEDTWRR